MAEPADVVAAARTRLGSPYAWGAAGPDRFDCSGLVVWAYARAGVTVPRTSQAQAVGGQPVARDQLRPGDVVVFYPTASHVGIYAGGGQVIHAPTAGRTVVEVPVDAAGPYNRARRYL
jgi:cell wall-associated NlpC family hydrolase